MSVAWTTLLCFDFGIARALDGCVDTLLTEDYDAVLILNLNTISPNDSDIQL